MMVTKFEHLRNSEGVMDIRHAGLCGLKKKKWFDMKRDTENTYCSPEKRMGLENAQSGQIGVGVGGRTQGQRAPPAHGTPVGEGGSPGRPTRGRTWPPVSPSWMCGGGEEHARVPELGVPPYCPPPRGAEDAPSTPSPPVPTGGPRPPPALPSSVAIDLPGTGERGPPSEGAEAGGSATLATLWWRRPGSTRASRGSAGRDMGTGAIKVFFTREI